MLDSHAELLAAAGTDLDSYMSRAPQLQRTPRVAYFSAEFAITECLPIYSGGLGVLAGDHVAAGHDAFPAELIEAYLSEYRESLGLTHEQFMSLGRRDPNALQEEFSMTVLALRNARNAVSQLHGTVSRSLWRGIGVGVGNAEPRCDMEAITNGVHTATWAGPDMTTLFDRTLGHTWRVAPHDASVWARVAAADPGDMWAARNAQRARLLERIDLSRREEGLPGLEPSLRSAPPLVIGFARRFATYKRAGLMLQDQPRLATLLTDSARPVVLLFAGKAHPQDGPGKLLVQQVVQASREDRFRGHIVFLENYDVGLAGLLVQGSDVWLNTPRRPMEASGTSGMKAALNGALNVSELDGWWDEAYAPGLGWALGEGIPTDSSDEARDRTDAADLLHLLESEIVPLFFQRDAAGLPAVWLQRVQRSIEAFGGTFSAHRMVIDYAEPIYHPLSGRGADPCWIGRTVSEDSRAA